MHSLYSDGTDTPGSLLRNVRAAGLDIFALIGSRHRRGHAPSAAVAGAH